MLKIYYKGKMRRVLSMQRGYDDIAAWYDKNKRKIWPDDSARSNALRVTLPEKGTEEWAYWVHAVDALRTVGAAEDCCMYLLIDGKRYYLIDSPDGSEPLQVEGNALYFSGEGAFPTEGVGATVRVVMVIPQRCGSARYPSGEWQYGQSQYYGAQYDEYVEASPVPGMPDGHVYSSWRGMLPILPNTRIEYFCSKENRNENVRFWWSLSGLKEGQLVCKSLSTLAGGGRWNLEYHYTLKDESNNIDSTENYFINGSGNEYHAGDVGYTLEMRTWKSGGSSASRVNVVHPQFSKDVDLPVESVNEITL